MDYGIYLTVINNLDIPLANPSYSADHGSWKKKPTTVAAQSSSIQFHLADSFGFFGGEGTLSYSLGYFGTLSVKFGCPIFEDNYFKISKSPYQVKVTYVGSHNGKKPQSGFPHKGQPLHIWITVSPSDSQEIELKSLLADSIVSPIGLPNVNRITTDISSPIWEPDLKTSDGQGGSYFPVAFTGTVSFIMPVNISSVVSLKITGVNHAGHEIIRGTWQQGRSFITLIMAKPSSGFFSSNQVLHWKACNMHDSTQEFAFDSSNQDFTLEFYGLFNRPVSAVFPTLGYIQVYRTLASNIGNMISSRDMAAKITSYCLLNPGTTLLSSKNIYDRMNGSSHYGVLHTGGSTFRLLEYIDAKITRHFCNCYDQAAGVQALMAIVGLSTQWYFMRPFGFINTTPLVGWGPCNNPFITYSEALILNQNDPNRTAFGNHGFCAYSNYILDATSSGHVGSESLSTYVTNAVDSTTTLYTNSVRRGTAADARIQDGLTNIGAVASGVRYPSLTELRQHPHIQELLGGGLNISLPDAIAERYVVIDWSFVEDLLKLNGMQYQLIAQYTTLGEQEVERVWHFIQGENIVSILVSVHSEEEIALRKLLTTAAETQASFNPFIVQQLGDGGLRSRTGELIEWKYANCWVRITTTTPETDTLSIATTIQHQMEQHLQPTISRPSLTDIPPELQATAGTELTFTWHVEPGILTETGSEGDGLDFIRKTENSITYSAIQPSLNTIRIVAADNRTLISNTATVAVHIR